MFSNLFSPVVSGSSTQSAALSIELARRGHRPFVISARLDRGTPAYEEVDGVPVYRLPAIRLPKLPISMNFPWLNCTFTPGNLRKIETIFKHHGPEIIHLHNHMFDLAFSAVLMRKRFRIPLVITVHTMIRHTTKLYNLLLYPADRILLRHLVTDQAQKLICPDINIENYVQNAFPRSPRVVVPYGITLPGEVEADSVEKLRGKHNLNGKRVILSLGNVIELRDRRDLIAALPDIRKTVPDAVIVIVGAEMTDRPRRLARQLGVEDAVFFVGHVPHEKVPTYLALADLEIHLFYQDTLERTSLGIASLEAMGAGKAVLAAANQDTYGKGILSNGENIVLVDRGNSKTLAETVVRLLTDSNRRRTIAERARQTIQEHFTWDSVCSKTIDVYMEVLGKHNSQ
jgi:glycosyltransferase involved in cell wall biosynthesis